MWYKGENFDQLWPKSNVFIAQQLLQAADAIPAKVRRTLIMCYIHAFSSSCRLVLSKLFLLPKGPGSTHKHHCLQGLLTASQENLRAAGSTLTKLPRRAIHLHQLGSTHTLSVSQRHHQWTVRAARDSAMSWIKFLLAIQLHIIQHHLCFVDYHFTSDDIIQLNAPLCEIKTIFKDLICKDPTALSYKVERKSQW